MWWPDSPETYSQISWDFTHSMLPDFPDFSAKVSQSPPVLKHAEYLVFCHLTKEISRNRRHFHMQTHNHTSRYRSYSFVYQMLIDFINKTHTWIGQQWFLIVEVNFYKCFMQWTHSVHLQVWVRRGWTASYITHTDMHY